MILKNKWDFLYFISVCLELVQSSLVDLFIYLLFLRLIFRFQKDLFSDILSVGESLVKKIPASSASMTVKTEKMGNSSHISYRSSKIFCTCLKVYIYSFKAEKGCDRFCYNRIRTVKTKRILPFWLYVVPKPLITFYVCFLLNSYRLFGQMCHFDDFSYVYHNFRA